MTTPSLTRAKSHPPPSDLSLTSPTLASRRRASPTGVPIFRRRGRPVTTATTTPCALRLCYSPALILKPGYPSVTPSQTPQNTKYSVLSPFPTRLTGLTTTAPSDDASRSDGALGILVSVLRITTKASLPQTPQGLRTSAHCYFIVSSSILLCCLLCCNVLYKLPVMQQHLSLQQPLYSNLKVWMVGRKIKWPASGVLIIYTVTLSIFPGFLAENLKSQLLQSWYPILLITVYNISDFVGKSLTALYLWQNIKSATWACILRLLFYPLFSACLRGPHWLRTEVPVVVLTFMLGLTNGYLTSVLMIMAPKTVHASEAELAAVFMVVFLGIGLVCGSVLGWFWLI